MDLMSVGKFARSRLTGKRNIMYEVKVHDIPARSLLCLLRHASNRQEVWDLGQDPVTAAQSQLALPLRDRAGAA